MELLDRIAAELEKGRAPAVAELTAQAVEQGLPPAEILDGGLIAGMAVVGGKFRAHEIFLPHVLLAARAMHAGLDLLKPLLIRDAVPTRGTAVLGTVRGDQHDIGKNLVGIMLEGAGFEVVDLGTDVSPREFVDAALAHGAVVIGMSALLTTTMPVMAEVVDLVKAEGLAGRVRTVVGGAPVTEDYAREIGADAYAFDGASAVDRIRALCDGGDALSAALKERLARGEVVLADGALGTQLMDAGLAPGAAPEAWNLTRFATVAGVAAAYADAGAEIVTTNSFGASPLRLAAHGLADRCAEINRAAAAAAREGAAGRALVSGSIGPCGGLLAPLGDIPAEEAARGFREQAEALIEGGADLICVETMIDLEEAVLAVRAARAALPDGVVMASLTFEPTPRGWFTVMGNAVPEAAAALKTAGADVVGSNCGQGVDGMLEVARAFGAATDLPLLIQANAGLPILEAGVVRYPETPEEMAAAVPALLAAGVRVLGGCCGTTPEHVAAMRRALDTGLAAT